MGLTGFGAIDIMIRSRKNRLQNIIFTVLHYIYALLVFGPMNINMIRSWNQQKLFGAGPHLAIESKDSNSHIQEVSRHKNIDKDKISC